MFSRKRQTDNNKKLSDLERRVDSTLTRLTKATLITLTGRLAQGPGFHGNRVIAGDNGRLYSVPLDVLDAFWNVRLFSRVEFQVVSETDEWVVAITRVLDETGVPGSATPEKAGRHVSERTAQGPMSIGGPSFNVQAELKGRR